jgi:methyltransferase (TIGR00027 family)
VWCAPWPQNLPLCGTALRLEFNRSAVHVAGVGILRGMPPNIPAGIGMTAVGVAYIRAQESLRADKLFDDPLAATFVEESGWKAPSELVPELGETSDEQRAFWGAIAVYVIVRTKFLDDYCLDAAAAGLRQFVILGAGLDARAFRLDWPGGTRVFELDVPDVNEFKARALGRTDANPRCERVVVDADLTGDWIPTLCASGFDASLPTGWMAEGLLIYFTPEQNDVLMTQISDESPSGSRIAMTLAGKGGLDVPDLLVESGPGAASVRSVPEMWKSEAPDDPAAWLGRFGWTADVFGTRERAAAYGRPFPESAPESAMRALVRGVRV